MGSNLFLTSVTVFMGLFAIMNPFTSVSVYLSVTRDYDEDTTRQVAKQSLLMAFVLVVVFCLGGKIIFGIFGISLSAFRITGGLIASMIGFQMLNNFPSPIHDLTGKEKQEKSPESAINVAFCPLAMPVLAGPGTIATAMNFSTGKEYWHLLITLVAFMLLCVITYLIFIFGRQVARLIGVTVLGLITRIMGLILLVIGIQMIIEGLTHTVEHAL